MLEDAYATWGSNRHAERFFGSGAPRGHMMWAMYPPRPINLAGVEWTDRRYGPNDSMFYIQITTDHPITSVSPCPCACTFGL